MTARLVSALVISQLDYCNSVLTHLPVSTLAPLQRVLNAAVRLVPDLGPRDHVTPAMYELHWLPIAERIKFKLCLLVHYTVNGRAPSYLAELVTPVVNIPGRRRTCLSPLSWKARSGCSAFAFHQIKRFLSLHQECGTACPLTLDRSPTPSFSKRN